jgi:NADH dehydrogenase
MLLPTVDVVEADVHDRRRLGELVGDVDAVINLIGILHQRRDGDFRRVHVELPASIVEACKRAGVKRLIHMSALPASIDGASDYLRSKGEGEALVVASELDWTVFRPSVIFGPGDSFLGLFARLMRVLPVMALASPGARFQPVYVGDVAHCFAQSATDERTHGRRYDLCGPKAYTLRQLVEWVGEVSGHVRPIVPLGRGLSSLQARVLEMLPGKLMTRDNLASMSVDNVCSGPFPPVFGIVPATLESVAPSYLAPAAKHGRYDEFRASSGR